MHIYLFYVLSAFYEESEEKCSFVNCLLICIDMTIQKYDTFIYTESYLWDVFVSGMSSLQYELCVLKL